jgi:hypothetical protein
VLGITEWLERWNGLTRTLTCLSREFLQQTVLAPAERLARELACGPDYVSWLDGRCRALEGRTAALVASHGDLTMSNMLLAADGTLGIVDWEEASEASLPLQDFFYAALDGAAARRGYRDRSRAFDDCFRQGGSQAPLVERFATRLQHRLGLPDELAVLSFHACWLHHAANERRKRTPGEAMPFLGFVKRIAADGRGLTPWGAGW